MKKAAIILLLCIYSLATLGIGIKQFYCCGILKSTTVTLIKNSEEKCKAQAAKGSCCKTQYQTFKVKDSHIFSDVTHLPEKQFSELIIFNFLFETIQPIQSLVISNNPSHAPPPLCHGIPLHIYYCIYRI
jgi:hypothetical protein